MSYHRINIPLSLSLTAGKRGFEAHSKLASKSDNTIIVGDVACQRKLPQVRTKTSTSGPNNQPEARRAEGGSSAQALRTNPKPKRVAPAAIRTNPKQPDIFIRGVIPESTSALAAYVRSTGAKSDRCTLVAQFQRNGEVKTKNRVIGPIEKDKTEKFIFRFKGVSRGIPSEVKFNLHCPVDSNVTNNSFLYQTESDSGNTRLFKSNVANVDLFTRAK